MTRAAGAARRRGAGLVAAALLATAMLFLRPDLGAGHAALVKSDPPARSTVARAPARVQLWFTERLEPAFSRLAVRDGAGARVDQGDVMVGPDDGKLLSVGLPPLGPGPYTVEYRVLSVDGHVVEGRFSFTVRGRRP